MTDILDVWTLQYPCVCLKIAPVVSSCVLTQGNSSSPLGDSSLLSMCPPFETSLRLSRLPRDWSDVSLLRMRGDSLYGIEGVHLLLHWSEEETQAELADEQS